MDNLLPAHILADPDAVREANWRLNRGGRRQKEKARKDLLETYGLSLSADAVSGEPCSAAGVPRSAGHGELDSILALDMLVAWAWSAKKLSAVQIQKYAQAAHTDQVEMFQRLKRSKDHASKRLSLLAAIGNHGKSSENCKRDLMIFLGGA